MKSATSAQRPYQEVGAMIRDLIITTPYNPGERLPPEREIAEMLDVTRTVVREALIMLEIQGLVEVRRGAGIYVLDSLTRQSAESAESADANVCNDAGPFELLQARQLLESNIAEFAALQATREDIVKMRQALQLEERELASSAPGSSESGDMQFHLAIAEATHNSMLVELFRQSWQWRENNPMWIQLHSHLDDSLYRKEWLGDHKQILAALIKKDARAAKLAMWQHLENVKQRLLEFSNVDDIYFDGYLFDSWPLDKVDI
ncbi:TPA: Uxu operon transcriptional regulator [Escherichia albertii]|uniref:Transcriptional regulator, GntR family n=1 Tax=Escherichia albertii (strain TW07627) TaxID=502347 RepID=A0ABC9NMV6_ESCAT|nr:Uxu operon transcriptional regulator [Escherichia albertii]AHE59418.1 DNA-binding transcriptional repressor UxuR [Escherichia albertii KF1]EDS91586.1 transcriptional regulator, GntR family [Escherichia albertii TW07627]EFE6907423.1 GntR family transcriptional regulator [Escherichia albertii]EFF0774444.1 Uxu operon transcriptional regulator [Escherichia albertii]EKG0290705.1 Uxu operon transcriptional regulator [Escherichia albertii]